MSEHIYGSTTCRKCGNETKINSVSNLAIYNDTDRKCEAGEAAPGNPRLLKLLSAQNRPLYNELLSFAP